MQKIGGRAQTAHCDASGSIPVIRVAEGIREYADAATETDPIAGPSHESMSPMPPAYTAEAEPLNSKEVLDHAHPREEGHNGEGDEAYEALVEALGIRCTVQEEELQIPKAERGKRGARTSSYPALARRRTDSSRGDTEFVLHGPPEFLLETWYRQLYLQ